MQSDPRTGYTSSQVLSAPPNAIYVWCNHHTKYIEGLCLDLNRADLTVVTPSWITNDKYWLGGRFSGIVVDHALWNMLPKNSKFLHMYELALTRTVR